MKALRFNDSKPKLGYFARSFSRAMEAVARVKEFGANKYADGNWKLGGKPDSEYLDSMTRHIDYFLKGEKFDQDSGCHHLGHAIWNLCAWLELNDEGPLIDEKLFKERMEYWAKEKEKKAKGKPMPPGGMPEFINHPCETKEEWSEKSLQDLKQTEELNDWIVAHKAPLVDVVFTIKDSGRSKSMDRLIKEMQVAMDAKIEASFDADGFYSRSRKP